MSWLTRNSLETGCGTLQRSPASCSRQQTQDRRKPSWGRSRRARVCATSDTIRPTFRRRRGRELGLSVDETAGITSGLRFLTDSDRGLLLERARSSQFVRGDVIQAEGSRHQAMYVLRSGFVRIERAYLGQPIAVARRGPGEFMGEMSFLESSGASASVVADSDVEVAVVSAEDVRALLAFVPGFATRFYESLALTLSQRLRELTSSLPPLIAEDVPQVTPLHSERAGRPGYANLPPTLVDAVESFKSVMLEVDRALKDRKLSAESAQARVTAGCDKLVQALRDHIQRDGHLGELTISGIDSRPAITRPIHTRGAREFNCLIGRHPVGPSSWSRSAVDGRLSMSRSNASNHLVFTSSGQPGSKAGNLARSIC